MMIAALAMLAAWVPHQDDAVTIELMSDRHAVTEAAGAAQLRRLLDTYDLSRWTFTDHVVIEAGVIPHSHPVLTLSANSLDDDEEALATYLHEQIHWYASPQDDRVQTAMAALREMYPDLPVGGREGARDEASNYLHLIVITLEGRALEALLGDEAARAVFGRKTYYRALYRLVLEEADAIEAVMAAHGIERP